MATGDELPVCLTNLIFLGYASLGVPRTSLALMAFLTACQELTSCTLLPIPASGSALHMQHYPTPAASTSPEVPGWIAQVPGRQGRGLPNAQLVCGSSAKAGVQPRVMGVPLGRAGETHTEYHSISLMTDITAIIHSSCCNDA